MSSTLVSRRSARLPISWLLLLLLGLLYWGRRVAPPPGIAEHLYDRYESVPSEALLREAIRHSTQKLALELDIELENIDITLDEYQTLVDLAEEKFGRCQQYRLIVLQAGLFPCYSCAGRTEIQLHAGQTFKIGQTCGNERTRYGSELPVKGLKYLREMEGNIFEVLVAEYLKLRLFRYSAERKSMLQYNQLEDTALPLPPGNKILR